jgi:competence protein ComGC
MKIKHTYQYSKGFTLVELLIYIAGLLVLGSILSMLIVQFYSIYKEIVAIPRADRTALLIVDRITKEIRSADQIDVLESQFGVTAGVLDLDSITDSVTTEKKFYVENGVAKYQEDSDTPINLSSKDFTVSILLVYKHLCLMRYVLIWNYNFKQKMQQRQSHILDLQY